ncbi:hypothetical protein LOK49_LG12G01235 [Camellia lanceoleosa]|uniref:Uncharacterized protein n=1 Tax=Camellia lanceoleosa TaxID=1840588 RepID=A0ACC0FYA6_9ERIC|nr:hypothetical protein LOK49_LG12G01235 [Camellia lanceoleosa]
MGFQGNITQPVREAVGLETSPVASESGTSQLAASESDVLQLEMPRDTPSADELGSRLVVESKRGTSQSAASESVERQSQLAIEMPRDAPWDNQGGKGPNSDGQLQVLELPPLAVRDSELVARLKQKQRFEDPSGLSRKEIPSAEAVSQWVLDRISEVSRCLDLSFEGHEEEAM